MQSATGYARHEFTAKQTTGRSNAVSPIATPDPDDAGDGTLYADPAQLDDLEILEQAVEQSDRPNAAQVVDGVRSRLVDLLRSKMVEADDAPKIDARDWPEARGFHAQIVENVEGLDVPKHRLRQLRFSDGRIVYEVWTPIPRPLALHEIGLAANGQIPIGSWRLTYHVYSPEWCTCPRAMLTPHQHGLFHVDCGRLKKSKVEGAFDEHVRNLHMQTRDDEIYNGYYPTIPGNDIAHFNPHERGMAQHQGGEPILKYNPEILPNGKIADPYLRGGTEIRGGRAEHKRLTKDATELGPGSTKEWEKRQAEKKAKQKASDRLKVEKIIQRGPRQIGEL